MARIKKESGKPTRHSERIQVSKAIEKSKQEAAAKICKPKKKRRPRQRKSCRLLNLPGELRNKIYSFAIAGKGEMEVTPKGPGEPDLLRVCRQIRREAKAIYYRENTFWLLIEDYKGAAFVPFHRQAGLYARSEMCNVYYMASEGTPNWDNLIEWMKAYDDLEIGVPSLNDEKNLVGAHANFDGDEFLFSAVLKIMDTMPWLPWERKEDYLKALYRGLTGTSSGWVKPEDKIPAWRWS